MSVSAMARQVPRAGDLPVLTFGKLRVGELPRGPASRRMSESDRERGAEVTSTYYR